MKILGVEQRVQNFKDKGMQTQYEVKFLKSVFAFNVELSIVQALDMAQFIALKWNWRVESERFQYMEGQGSWISWHGMETRHIF